jgi:hypothetical protein
MSDVENTEVHIHNYPAGVQKEYATAAKEKKRAAKRAEKERLKSIRDIAEKKPKKARKGLGTDNTGGPGVIRTGADVAALANPDRSAEADAFLAETTNDPTVKAALKVLRDPNASPEAKRIAAVIIKQGAVQANLHGEDLPDMPAAHDATDVTSVGGPVDATYLAKQRMVMEACTDPVEKERLGSEYTLNALRMLHSRGQKERAVKAAEMAADDTPEIARLRELSKSAELSPDLRMQVGEVLTRHDLAKSAASESQERTNALVQQTQQNMVDRSATLGPDGKWPVPVGERDQVDRIGSGNGTPESLGTPQNIGTSKPGYITGREILEKELADEEARERPSVAKVRELQEKVTLKRLAATHEGGR